MKRLPPFSALFVVTAVALPPLSHAEQPATAPARPLVSVVKHSSLPPGIRWEHDVPYVEGGGRSQSMDLYYPEEAAKDGKPVPLVIWIHGGGWMAGSKEWTPAVKLLPHGYAVASLNYRLSQEAIFPAQIDDCKAAVRFLRKNAAKYHVDPDHIGVWGDSAGGHLVALLGTSGDVKEVEGSEGVVGVSSRVQAVCDWYGPTDFVHFAEQAGAENTLKAENPQSPISKLFGGPASQHHDLAVQASPITYVSSDDPPFLIMHGDRDPLVPVPQSQTLVDALKKAGVKATLDVLPGAGHGGKAFGTPERTAEIVAFYDLYLKPH